ncbi:hypothetical protein SUDANB146_06513 (plasmid) [Streptomyces sp. enrichment culture]
MDGWLPPTCLRIMTVRSSNDSAVPVESLRREGER